MFCTTCGKANSPGAAHCAGCGGAPGATAAVFTGSPDESLRTFLADNQDYYMQRFGRFEANGKTSPSWHWPAFFVTFYWLLYRKMWLGALLYFLMPYITIIALVMAMAMFGNPGDVAVAAVFLGFLAVIFVLPPVFANALYYRHAKGKIRAAELGTRDPKARFAEIARKGGTSGLIMVVAVVVGMVPTIGILAAIAIPVYVDYESKARMHAAVLEGDQAASAVGSYYETHQNVPATLAAAAYTASPAEGSAEIILNTENGSLTIVPGRGQYSHQKITLMPSVSATKKVTWACASEEIPDKHLPARCHRFKPRD